LLLRSGGLAISVLSKPKQTDTTQRWKASIQAEGHREPIRSKIEFSHSEADPRRALEAVPDRVVTPYALRPPTMLHYVAAAATEQKIIALAKRSETQARDVFDLDLLLRRHPDVQAGAIGADTVNAAIERALDLPAEAFTAQVVPFLDPDIVEIYEGPRAWAQIQSYVVNRLGELQ
jgi:Nucleotidyl transferase AbiEii toxin, Type IV TA system